MGAGNGSIGGHFEPLGRQRRVPSPETFNINPNQTYPGRNSNSNPEPNSLLRSNTFVIESNENDPTSSRPTRTVDITEFYNVQRRPRAKTPMTFNIMFDEPANETAAGGNETGMAETTTFWSTPVVPKINYSGKKKPKLVIGKQGREYGEFVWPLDVAVNNFNGQILVADSNNHRIQVFEPDGRFVRSFGRQGNREGQFDCIDGIFVDSMSNIYVVDRLNHSKYKLN